MASGDFFSKPQRFLNEVGYSDEGEQTHKQLIHRPLRKHNFTPKAEKASEKDFSFFA